MSQMIYLPNVVTLQLHADLCIGCGMCVEVCPHAVFEMDNGRAQIRERDACMECGACSKNCPVAAITVKSGVGCAVAVINTAIGRTGGACSCSCTESCDGK